MEDTSKSTCTPAAWHAELSTLSKRAFGGDGEAACRLVRACFPDSIHPELSPVTALGLRALRAALEAGTPEGLYLSGKMLFWRKNDPLVRMEGFERMSKAARDGCAEAWNELGTALMDWLLIDDTYEDLAEYDLENAFLPEWDDLPARAVEWFRRAIDGGFVAGWQGLAWAAGEGVGTPGGASDAETAHEYNRKGALAGDVHSMSSYGFELIHGLVGEKAPDISDERDREGLDWMLRAVEVERPDSQELAEVSAQLHELFGSDDGTLPEDNPYVKRYLAAAERATDLPFATPSQRRKNIELLLYACAHECGRDEAPKVLAMHDADRRDETATPARLRDSYGWLKLAAEVMQSSDAYRALARCHETGCGTYKNANKARKFRAAADRLDAMERLISEASPPA